MTALTPAHPAHLSSRLLDPSMWSLWPKLPSSKHSNPRHIFLLRITSQFQKLQWHFSIAYWIIQYKHLNVAHWMVAYPCWKSHQYHWSINSHGCLPWKEHSRKTTPCIPAFGTFFLLSLLPWVILLYFSYLNNGLNRSPFNALSFRECSLIFFFSSVVHFVNLCCNSFFFGWTSREVPVVTLLCHSVIFFEL